ncbi:DUF4124 domain-containing protein [Deefgea salmonis]|uniref:DUF4124 domain-containing protein n=1 Tax=Deefgea salmonis TaxID=2875502 RepID=A0ABS8BP32_9NEIS|nr:DUF4124 domain-containing protein [Deefgea salmonis]MCB5197498.1 DUF4124 domain-containing protein [Deefgea salmonis]
MPLLLFNQLSYAALYRWVDEAGKVQYSDKPPVGQSKSLMELDKSARVRKGNEAILTPEEKRDLAEKKRAEQELQRADKALLQSFSKPEEVDLLRDRQIAAVDAGMQTYILRRTTLQKRLEAQQSQLDKLNNKQLAISAELLADVAVTKKELADIDKAIATQQRAVIAIKEKSDMQKKRLIELRNIQPH